MTQARPAHHISPPRGWMNDPCAPVLVGDRYHVWYQWVPSGINWSNAIGWGHAWSSDLVRWEYDEEPALMPSESYDCMGVFSGCAVSSGDKLHVVYSAINETFLGDPHYAYGQERLAVATSEDGGKRFRKDTRNPLPVMPPLGITGWRDPYVAAWEELRAVRKDTADSLYAIVSGGLQNRGSTLFLYAVNNLIDWEYLGPLITPQPAVPRPTSAWTGDWGINWECGGFFELDRSYVLVAPQGHFFEPLEPARPQAPVVLKKWQLWAAGSISVKSGHPEMALDQQGVLDWGCLYATQTFKGSGGRRLMIGWLPEDDLHELKRLQKGYYGHMSCVRELFVQDLGDVQALKTPMDQLQGVRNGKTLGIRPASEIDALRRNRTDVPSMPECSRWEVELDADVGTETVSLKLLFAQGSATVLFHPEQERIVVDRTRSCEDPIVNVSSEYGAHTLFRTQQGQERLRLRVFFDETVLEVFANDRFALSTHVYGGTCRLELVNPVDVKAQAWQT